jgi:hypothetical protein
MHSNSFINIYYYLEIINIVFEKKKKQQSCSLISLEFNLHQCWESFHSQSLDFRSQERHFLCLCLGQINEFSSLNNLSEFLFTNTLNVFSC